jgi:hypothetical protein
MKTLRNRKYKYTKKYNKIKNKTKKYSSRSRSRVRSKVRGGMGFGIGNVDIFSKDNQPNKYYDSKSGKWLNQDCYKLFGFPYCTIPHS